MGKSVIFTLPFIGLVVPPLVFSSLEITYFTFWEKR